MLRSTLGLQYLSVLLSRPGTPVHVLDLVVARDQKAPPAQAGNPHSDPQARAEYRARLQDLAREIDAADADNDLGRRERLQEERDFIEDELSRSFSISGSSRQSGSDTERARISTRNRIAASLRALRVFDPDCATFLQRSIQTGALCVYDPIEPIKWEL
jgi:hypothetical protein